MSKSNDSLKKSRDTKDDEFYTRMIDIENEISQYDLSQFYGKVVYCNCDDPTWSNFYKFFIKWGKKLKLKEVHFTNYSKEGRNFKEYTIFDYLEAKDSIEDDANGTAHHWIYNPENGKVVKKILKGNGDFRSEECLNILDKSDIIVTNPPFSLLTEFIETIISHKKQFLIIGNENEIASRSFCNHFKNNEIWIGNTHPKEFDLGNGGVKKLGFVCWYTNLDVPYRNKPIQLHTQDMSQFKKYDNYDAIEVNKAKLIPDNYYGNMGMSIFFLEKFCPQQFEIVDMEPAYLKVPTIDGKKTYRRIIIRRKDNGV